MPLHLRALGGLTPRWGKAAITVVLTAMGGCASSSEGPELVRLSAAKYADAFDAAVEAARQTGMPAALRDRRGGVIETTPQVAGSVLEPWRSDNDSIDQSFENTIAYQRRRARFEFTPAGYTPPADDLADAPLTGPDHVASGRSPLDLTEIQDELDLRVWVYVERAHIPGVRRSTWTRAKTSQALLVYPEGMKDRKGVTIHWSPVARDPAYERRLLRQVQEALANAPEAVASQPILAHSEPPHHNSE